MSVMYSHVFKYSDEELRRNQEMDSSIGHPQQHCHQHNSGLLRYLSAPSSLLTSLVDNKTHSFFKEEAFRSEDHQSYLPSTSSEMDTMLSKLISSNNGWSNSEPLPEFGGKPVKQEAVGESVPKGPSQHNDYSYGGSLLIYQSQKIHGLPNASSSSSGASANAIDGSFCVVNSIPSENSTQSKMGVRNCSNLIREKSSPAEFFSNENGFAALREVGSFRASDVSNGQDTASTSGLHGTLAFSSLTSSCLRRMPRIDENESLEANSDQSRNLDADFCYQNPVLTNHLSLPSSSTKMASIEKFLQIQGSVPCKIRAKRGFATHPRSIAERVRRTRISERIKKLQGVLPKSDKQTSTADMLDLAVEYIKDLQEQVKILTDSRAKCKCTSN